ncbi:glycoside hydrolase family 18 protein [Hydnum rufescens UP504]|uniref:Glycoside hydrolase family 18 protein n=1 Tax=Hydnum rufescens UP504 TaxID=1448309 RepID=A0A9P6DZD5_9AGAM|nr:glycoside hydrolase family 18 protein [Hydnum rufescens UP504]
MATPTSLVSLPSSQLGSSPATSGTSSATPSPVPASGTNRAPLTNPVVATYYPDWAFESMAPEQVDFARFDWVDFAFAVPTSSFDLEWTQDNSAALLNRLVNLAHVANKRVKLSYFSPAVATPASRATFVKNIVAMYEQFDLDAHCPHAALITAAVATTPFASSSPPTPLASVASFSAVLDYILLMNYDQPWPKCTAFQCLRNSTQPDASVVGAVRSWTTAGFDKSKILLGVPSYGYVQKSQATSLRQRGVDILPILVPEDSTVISAPAAASAAPLLSGTGNQIQFIDLVQQGVIQLAESTGSPTLSPASTSPVNRFQRYWDACSSTPFLMSLSQDQLPLFPKVLGIAGVNMFDVHGDTADYVLTDALRSGLGLPSVPVKPSIDAIISGFFDGR